MYRWVPIQEAEQYESLGDAIAEEYGRESVIARLKATMSPAVRGVLVETGYIDKDYRSTYYNYYAKKGRAYRQDCIRLHFFDALVSFDEASVDVRSPDGRPEDHYFGYMVLRPTHVATIGRSVLSPDIRKGAHGSVIQAEHKVHLLGRRLKVSGFPSTSSTATSPSALTLRAGRFSATTASATRCTASSCCTTLPCWPAGSTQAAWSPRMAWSSRKRNVFSRPREPSRWWYPRIGSTQRRSTASSLLTSSRGSRCLWRCSRSTTR